jgi:hypothetical protein
VQREHQAEVASGALSMQGQDAVEYPVVSVHDVGPFQAQDPREVPHSDWIGNGQVMLPLTCVNAGQAHRHRLEPVHSHSRGEHFSVERFRDMLGRDGDLMPTRGEDIRQIEYVPFLAADIGREELSSEQNTHQVVPYSNGETWLRRAPVAPRRIACQEAGRNDVPRPKATTTTVS